MVSKIFLQKELQPRGKNQLVILFRKEDCVLFNLKKDNIMVIKEFELVPIPKEEKKK